MKNINKLFFGILSLAVAHSVAAAEIGVTGMFAQGGFDNDYYQESSDE